MSCLPTPDNHHHWGLAASRRRRLHAIPAQAVSAQAVTDDEDAPPTLTALCGVRRRMFHPGAVEGMGLRRGAPCRMRQRVPGGRGSPMNAARRPDSQREQHEHENLIEIEEMRD